MEILPVLLWKKRVTLKVMAFQHCIYTCFVCSCVYVCVWEEKRGEGGSGFIKEDAKQGRQSKAWPSLSPCCQKKKCCKARSRWSTCRQRDICCLPQFFFSRASERSCSLDVSFIATTCRVSFIFKTKYVCSIFVCWFIFEVNYASLVCNCSYWVIVFRIKLQNTCKMETSGS